VTYLRLIAVDTIDEAILSTLERKSAMARSLLGDDGESQKISSFSREEMCSLLLNNRLPGSS
jgi:SNF2 family DNA or RNA helicase